MPVWYSMMVGGEDGQPYTDDLRLIQETWRFSWSTGLQLPSDASGLKDDFVS